MKVGIVVDPDQQGLLGYVETWIWKDRLDDGYVIVRRGGELKLYGGQLESCLQLVVRFTSEQHCPAGYHCHVRPEIIRRFTSGQDHLVPIDSFVNESSRQDLREAVESIEKRSRHRESLQL
jgi:hypothetical protein